MYDSSRPTQRAFLSRPVIPRKLESARRAGATVDKTARMVYALVVRACVPLPSCGNPRPGWPRLGNIARATPLRSCGRLRLPANRPNTAAGKVRGRVDQGFNVSRAFPTAPDTSTRPSSRRFRPNLGSGARRARVRSHGSAAQTAGILIFPLSPRSATLIQRGPASTQCLDARPARRPQATGHGLHPRAAATRRLGEPRPLRRRRLCLGATWWWSPSTTGSTFFGYLYLGELGGPEYAASGNVGMIDLVLALKWVRDNIAEFWRRPAMRS